MKHAKLFFCLATAVLGALLLFAGPAAADKPQSVPNAINRYVAPYLGYPQQGYNQRYYYPQGTYYGYDPYYYRYDPGYYYYYSSPRTYYYSEPIATEAPSNAALVNVRIPARAELWFGGDKTTQAGSLRQFVTPPLDPGRSYAYELRARWQEGGQLVDRTRKITVHAGDRLTVDFLRAEAEVLSNPTAEP